jgi:acyl carrier protein
MFVDNEQVLSEIAEIIRDVLEAPDLTVKMMTTAENVVDWDSFNHINIVVAIEAHFGVKFQMAEIEEVRNVGELVDLVHDKLSAHKSRL